MQLFKDKLDETLVDFLHHTLKSYHKWTKRTWPTSGTPKTEAWLESILASDQVLVSHGTQEDPIFNFGNPAALNLFEMSFDDFTKLPSRKSAEPMLREERDALIQSVRENGYTDSYQGVRISSTGKRFYLPQATVWNVVDDEETYVGQAATFSKWEFLD